jgi:hypothetical protein
VPQIGEFANGVRETSKLGEIGLIFLFQIGVFTSFNCGLVTTQNISIIWVPQIGKCANGVQETSKRGGTRLIFLFQIGVFYLIQSWTCHNSRHFDYLGATNWRICQWKLGNFKAWWN